MMALDKSIRKLDETAAESKAADSTTKEFPGRSNSAVSTGSNAHSITSQKSVATIVGGFGKALGAPAAMERVSRDTHGVGGHHMAHFEVQRRMQLREDFSYFDRDSTCLSRLPRHACRRRCPHAVCLTSMCVCFFSRAVRSRGGATDDGGLNAEELQNAFEELGLHLRTGQWLLHVSGVLYDSCTDSCTARVAPPDRRGDEDD